MNLMRDILLCSFVLIVPFGKSVKMTWYSAIFSVRPTTNANEIRNNIMGNLLHIWICEAREKNNRKMKSFGVECQETTTNQNIFNEIELLAAATSTSIIIRSTIELICRNVCRSFVLLIFSVYFVIQYLSRTIHKRPIEHTHSLAQFKWIAHAFFSD